MEKKEIYNRRVKKAEEDLERKWVPVYRSEQVEETADRSRDERPSKFWSRQLLIQVKNPAVVSVL
jgi:hypothetical protein